MSRKKSKRVKNVDKLGHNYNEEASFSPNPCIQAGMLAGCFTVASITFICVSAGIANTAFHGIASGFVPGHTVPFYVSDAVDSFCDGVKSAAVSIGSAVLSRASAMVTSPAAMTVVGAAVGLAVGYGLFSNRHAASEMREKLNQHADLPKLSPVYR